MTKYAENLSGILESRGMRKSDLVNSLQIPDSTVRSWWKKDAIPSADAALKVAKFLGVSVEFLMTGKDASFPPMAEPSKFEKMFSALTASQRKAVEAVMASYLDGEKSEETTA